MGQPETEYGEWTRGNMGRVGRCVTTYIPSGILPGEWMPVVSWEEHPDEAGLPYPYEPAPSTSKEGE